MRHAVLAATLVFHPSLRALPVGGLVRGALSLVFRALDANRARIDQR
jgi:hypothetical protein